MRCRIRPIEIEVAQWNGHNLDEVCSFMGETEQDVFCRGLIFVHSPSGPLFASIGDFIMKTDKGEFYTLGKRVFDRWMEVIE